MPPRKATVRRRGTGLAGCSGVDAPDRPEPPAEGDQDGQGRQRLERPAEQEVWRDGGSVGAGPWAGGRCGGERGSHGRTTTPATVARRARDARNGAATVHGSHRPHRPTNPLAGAPTTVAAPGSMAAVRAEQAAVRPGVIGRRPRPCPPTSPRTLHGEPPRTRPLLRRARRDGHRRRRAHRSPSRWSSGVDVIGSARASSTGLYPPQAVTDAGQAIRELYTIVFLIAVAIFFVVEGPDHLDGHPLPPQAG